MKKTQDTQKNQAAGPAEDFWGRQEFVLQGDGGAELTFSGRLFSEGSFFDDESGTMTRLKLFITDSKHLVYSVITGAGADKSRRVYELSMEGEICHIFNGLRSVSLPMDLLFVAVSGLCGIAPGHAADELRANLEESLRAVGS